MGKVLGFILILALVALVALMARIAINSCSFDLGDKVVTKSYDTLFTEYLPRGTSVREQELHTACSVEAGESLIIATDPKGTTTQFELDFFECWHYVWKNTSCQGWTFGSNLTRIVNEN